MNQIFLESFYFFFTTVDQTTRKYAFQALTSFHLSHYKCPEQHLHKNTRNWYMDFDSPGKPRTVNWFPCYKETRHLACFDLFRPEQCATKIWSQRIFSTSAFDIDNRTVHVKCISWCEYLANIDKHYAASWFIQLRNSNVYSWSNAKTMIDTGEMANFCDYFALGK